MTTRYRNLLFSPAVQAAQTANGSRKLFETDLPAPEAPDRLGPNEAAFIADRDSCYVSTVGADGWPYIQHRGGPRGFVRVLDDRRIGFADFRGNRQYITLGNVRTDARAAFFFMDYARRARLKLLGRMRPVDLNADPDLAARLQEPGYRSRAERGFIVEVEAFDWNCPQHITQRFTADEVRVAMEPLQARIAELEARLEAVSGAPL